MREKEVIKKNYITIAYYCGVGIIMLSFSLLLPLLILPFFPHETKHAHLFLKPWIVSTLIGIIIYLIFKRQEKAPVSLTHASVIVVFLWIWVSLIGAVPFNLHGPYTYLHGLFEAVSGWSTTGLTVVDVEKVPKLILMWRSIMQYMGGAGLVIIMLTIISGPSASSVFRSEGHQNEIRPQVKHASAMVMKIYLVFLAAGTIGLMAAGMDWFDAINHCMSCLATSGFSTRAASISYYNSMPIEIVLIILMLLGQTNFSVHNQLFMGHWKVALRNVEVRTTIVTLMIVIPLMLFLVGIPFYKADASGFLNFSNLPDWWGKYGEAIRSTTFVSVSAMTGTGFNSIPSYMPWGDLSALLITIIMCFGGHTNSTACGMKQLRIHMIYKSIQWYIQDQFIPNSAVTKRYIYQYEGKTFIKPEHIREMFNYIGIYVITLLLGGIIICSYGYSMRDSLFEFSSALGTAGLTSGITTFNAPAGVLITEIIGMFLGRLEFFVVFFSIIKIVRDIQSYFSQDQAPSFSDSAA